MWLKETYESSSVVSADASPPFLIHFSRALVAIGLNEPELDPRYPLVGGGRCIASMASFCSRTSFRYSLISLLIASLILLSSARASAATGPPCEIFVSVLDCRSSMVLTLSSKCLLSRCICSTSSFTSSFTKEPPFWLSRKEALYSLIPLDKVVLVPEG